MFVIINLSTNSQTNIGMNRSHATKHLRGIDRTSHSKAITDERYWVTLSSYATKTTSMVNGTWSDWTCILHVTISPV